MKEDKDDEADSFLDLPPPIAPDGTLEVDVEAAELWTGSFSVMVTTGPLSSYLAPSMSISVEKTHHSKVVIRTAPMAMLLLACLLCSVKFSYSYGRSIFIDTMIIVRDHISSNHLLIEIANPSTPAPK